MGRSRTCIPDAVGDSGVSPKRERAVDHADWRKRSCKLALAGEIVAGVAVAATGVSFATGNAFPTVFGVLLVGLFYAWRKLREGAAR